MKRVLILTERDDCAALARMPLAEFDCVVLAFWCAPEFAERVCTHGAHKVWRLADLISGYAAQIEYAYQLARQFVTAAPLYRGVNPLQAWENVIANALVVPVMAKQLAESLRAQMPDATEIHFLAPSDTARAFQALQDYITMPRVILHTPAAIERAPTWSKKIAAGVALVQETRRTREWRRLFWETLQALDARYAWRARFTRGKKIERGQVWFYSSYINFTRALAKYAPTLETSPQWLVNSYSAWQGLTKCFKLWQFRAHSDKWAQQKIFQEMDALRATLAQTSSVELRLGLETNHELREVLTRVLELALTEIDFMHAFLDQAAPRALWTANQWGSEGLLLQLATQRNIPTTLVQHGTLEHFYRCAPIYSNEFLVWSDFWASGITASEMNKVRLAPFSDSTSAIPPPKPNGAARLTFFTAPPHWVKLGNPTVVLWEVVTLLNTLAQANHSILVRIHPADEIEPYVQAWRAYCGPVPPNVRFDKHNSLDAILDQTDLALMLFSTVFVNCHERGIPIVGLGWYDFVWKNVVTEAGYIRYGNSLKTVAEAVLELV